MCYNPVTIKCADGVHTMKVPCGHCLACVKAYQQTWVARLEEERKSWQLDNGQIPIVFFTLTYSQDRIPKNFLQLTTTGVHLTKQPLFALPVTHWNTVLKEPERDAKDRQKGIEEDFRSMLKVYLDTFDEKLVTSDLEMNTEDLPLWTFGEDSVPAGVPLSDTISFNSVRYADVRSWLQKCKVYFRRFGKVDRVQSLKKPWKTIPVNSRYIYNIDGTRLPDSAIPAGFKYFICSEYGPRTLRPHYHGVMFGVTIEEFDKHFRPLWENCFGHVESSAFDSTKGGMLYVSKYCAKGSYDNPFSKKDFFYPNGKEYHSDKYEGSLLHFGVNLPLSDPCFRLMSNGLGIGYVFRKKSQDYWRARIDQDFVVRSYDLVSAPPSIPYEDLPNSLNYSKYAKTYRTLHYEVEDCFRDSLYDHEDWRFISASSAGYSGFVKCEDFFVRTYNNRGRLLAESVFDVRLDSNLELEDRLIIKKYARNFVYHPKNADKGVLVSKIAESALPRYYHRWLIPPSAKLHLAAAALRRDMLSDADKWRQVRFAGDSDDRLLALGELERCAALEQKSSIERLRKSSDRFYSKFDPEDLKDAKGLANK